MSAIQHHTVIPSEAMIVSTIMAKPRDLTLYQPTKIPPLRLPSLKASQAPVGMTTGGMAVLDMLVGG